MGLFMMLAATSAASASQASLVQIIDTSQFSPSSPDPAGIVYLEASDTFIVSDSEVNEMSIFTGDNLFEMTPDGFLTDTLTTTSFSNEPTGVAYNAANGHLFFTDDNAREIFEVDPGSDGIYDTSDDVVTSFDTSVFNSRDPEGITFDTWDEVLFIVDGNYSEVHRIDPGPNGIFDGVPPMGDDETAYFDTFSLGVKDPEGIAFNPDNGNLFIIGEPIDSVAEVTIEGDLVRIIDISAAPAVMPGGLAYAPSSVNPSEMNLFITDRGVDNNDDPNENDGKVYEMSLPYVTPGNMPPTVSAGSDQTITVPDDAVLDGTVLDDGLPEPPGQVITTWSQLSGPGTVTFMDVNAADTIASFSTIGTYALRLTADDGELKASDEINIVVTGPSGELVTEIRVSASTDDAEERDTGNISRGSSDLEFVFDRGGDQTVGIRFNEVEIPREAEILYAYVQFQVDETNSVATSLTIQGQDSDNAGKFLSSNNNISSRSRTAAAVSWAPVAWTTVGEAGIDQRTPDIASVIQEIINRSGWSSGNSLVIIITGTGERTAESFDGDPTAAPLLHVEYTTDLSDTSAPVWDGLTVGLGSAADTTTGGSVTVEFDTASDDIASGMRPTGPITRSWWM
jgi:hypothetical protein